MKPAVTLRDVTFRYPEAATPALEGVDFVLQRGELVAVTGPIGAGASTLLLVTAGFAPRLTGGTLTGERTLNVARPGVVFATPWTQLTGIAHTVLGEVAFGPASHAMPRAAALAAADRTLGLLGIAHLAGRNPLTLSGGELQRVVVASALALDPDLLVLDDPGAELDPEGADALYATLAGVAASGAAVLVATPDLERAARVAGRALRLEQGRIVAHGPPARVLTETDPARIARAAGCPEPLPLDVASLVARVRR